MGRFWLIMFLFVVGCSTGNFVLIDGQRLEIEIADSPEERMQGLMFRDSLSENAGMLFVFDEPQEVSFWMKNMAISLDILFINEDKEIVQIYEAVEPCRNIVCLQYPSSAKVLYALEVNAGYAQKHYIEVGDKLDISTPK